MKKRKSISIALAAAVAISTVQLAYPANAFANEQVINKNIKKIETVNTREYTINDDEKFTVNLTATGNLENALTTMSGYSADKVKSLTISTSNNTVLNEKDFNFIRETLTKILELDLTNANCINNTIPNGAMEGCSSLAKIVLPIRNVTKIGENAFKNCIGLSEELVIPGNIEEICKGAFRIDGDDNKKNQKTISKLILSNGIKYIRERAFSEHKIGGDLNIPSSLIAVDSYGFIRCGFNGNLTFEKNSSLKGLFWDSFYGCDGFVGNLELPKDAESIILGGPFANCTGFNGNIIIGKLVPSINNNTFSNINNLDLTRSESLTVFNNGSKIKDAIVYMNKYDYEYYEKTLKNEISKENNIYAITNGGTFDDDTNFEKGKLATPKKNKQVFDGWYTKDGTDDNDWGTKVEGELKVGNVYYAKWKDITNKISLEYDKTETFTLEDGITIEVGEGDYDVIKIEGNTIKAIGVGNTSIKYMLNGKVLATQKVEVTKPAGTVAMIGRVPYDSLDKAVAVAESKIIEVEKEAKIELNSTLVINKPMTINFNGATLSKKATESNPSTKASDDNCLIKITSEGVIIKNANFDLSGGEEVAILVDGTNNASNVTLDGTVNATRKSSTSTGTEKAPVVKMVGGDSGVTIKENAKVNGTSNPSNGTADKVDIIVGAGASADKIINNNKTSGGGGNYIPSKPTYTHEKIEGLDRYETAAKIADKLGSYDNVVLVNAESSMSDGLAASGLAGKENGAILLTKKDSIPKATMDRLKKVKKVYIIGGEAAISQKVSDEITKNVPNVKVERLGGKTRVETSELVAKKLGNYNKVFVVNGFKGEADAMSASSVAAKNGAPILLTNGKTSTHAKKSGVEYYVIGGDTVVDKSIATKYDAEVLAGKDRYATNKEVINEFYSGRDKIYFANGETLVDALTASTLAKKDGIALVNTKSDKSVLKGKDTVQVGGMKFTIDFDK